MCEEKEGKRGPCRVKEGTFTPAGRQWLSWKPMDNEEDKRTERDHELSLDYCHCIKMLRIMEYYENNERWFHSEFVDMSAVIIKCLEIMDTFDSVIHVNKTMRKMRDLGVENRKLNEEYHTPKNMCTEWRRTIQAMECEIEVT